jgi:hypothetical protein
MNSFFTALGPAVAARLPAGALMQGSKLHGR